MNALSQQDNSIDVPIILDEIDLHITNRCNLKCNFCSVKANEHNYNDLSLKQIFQIISQAHNLGMKELHLTGGEPALRQDLEQIINYAFKKGIKTRVITNGTLINKERLYRLQDAGLLNIMVSIDGLEQTHNMMRDSSTAWEKAINCVEMAVNLGFQTRIASVAFKNNLNEIPKLMEIANCLGTHIFSIFIGSPLGRGIKLKDQVIDSHTWYLFLKTLLKDISKLRYGHNMEIIAEQGFLWSDTKGFNPDNIKGRGTGCSTLLKNFDYLIVKGDGNLYPCIFFLHNGVSLGNIIKQSFKSALVYAKKQKSYKKFVKPKNACKDCKFNFSCNGGCSGYSFLYFKNWHKPDPRCMFQQKIVKNNTFKQKILSSQQYQQYYPLCPIAKLNLRTKCFGGSSEQALS